jgi:hypothetical protein
MLNISKKIENFFPKFQTLNLEIFFESIKTYA